MAGLRARYKMRGYLPHAPLNKRKLARRIVTLPALLANAPAWFYAALVHPAIRTF